MGVLLFTYKFLVVLTLEKHCAILKVENRKEGRLK